MIKLFISLPYFTRSLNFERNVLSLERNMDQEGMFYFFYQTDVIFWFRQCFFYISRCIPYECLVIFYSFSLMSGINSLTLVSL